MEILAAKNWKSNAHLIQDVAQLGYLKEHWKVLDPTYGEGVWWQLWRPHTLITHDKFTLDGVDFRDLPHRDGEFDAVAYDPPYKLNGTDQGEGGRYGVARPMRWQDKMQMIHDGIDECARVLKRDGILLIKCQDQVCSGHVRWQTLEFTLHAINIGLALIERFDYYGGRRPQPMEGRTQRHAHGRGSTLLVLQKDVDRPLKWH